MKSTPQRQRGEPRKPGQLESRQPVETGLTPEQQILVLSRHPDPDVRDSVSGAFVNYLRRGNNAISIRSPYISHHGTVEIHPTDHQTNREMSRDLYHFTGRGS